MTPDEAAPTAPGHYRLTCPSCNGQLYDDGMMLECGKDHAPALLRTSYIESRFDPDNGIDGVFRYHDWLPVRRTLADAGRSVVYRSHRLAKSIGLSNLWIAFNGYWPERDATLETATFKELEANTVLGRLPQAHSMLSVASAGNTGAAFALSVLTPRHTLRHCHPPAGAASFQISRPPKPMCADSNRSQGIPRCDRFRRQAWDHGGVLWRGRRQERWSARRAGHSTSFRFRGDQDATGSLLPGCRQRHWRHLGS